MIIRIDSLAIHVLINILLFDKINYFYYITYRKAGNTMKNIKFITISTLLIIFTLSAQTTGYVSQIDDFLSTKLTNTDRNTLISLRESAIELAKMVKECNSVSINAVPNPECETYYKTTLPKFEQEFQKVSNGIYINSLKLTKSMNTKKEQINSCVESAKFFFSPSFYPENMIVVKNKKFDVTPTSNDDKVNVDFDIIVSFDSTRSEIFHKNLKKWYKVCYNVVSNGDEFNDYFIEQMKLIIPKDEYEVVGWNNATFKVFIKNHDYLFNINDITFFKTDMYKLITRNVTAENGYWIKFIADSREYKNSIDFKESFIHVATINEFTGKRLIKLSKDGIEGSLIQQ